jgi:hypothetical protein
VRALNSRRDRGALVPFSARDFFGEAIAGTVYARCGVGHDWTTNGSPSGSGFGEVGALGAPPDAVDV